MTEVVGPAGQGGIELSGRERRWAGFPQHLPESGRLVNTAPVRAEQAAVRSCNRAGAHPGHMSVRYSPKR